MALFFSCDALIEIRIGRTTNSASPTTMKFMIAATANTLCQNAAAPTAAPSNGYRWRPLQEF